MITDLEGLVQQRRAWKTARRRIVLTNGCFDLLHPGHLALLEAARAFGDLLIVALNSDRSVRAIKGPGRPILPATERAEVLLGLEAVDRVVVYDDPTPLVIVEALVPDVLVKGADWGADAIVGAKVVSDAGGQVRRVDLVPGQSTTSLVERIRRP